MDINLVNCVTPPQNPSVIVCDKRNVFAQGSEPTKQSGAFVRFDWIASRSLPSGGAFAPTRWLAMTEAFHQLRRAVVEHSQARTVTPQ